MLTSLISLTIAVSPNEDEIRADAQLTRRLTGAARARSAARYTEGELHIQPRSAVERPG